MWNMASLRLQGRPETTQVCSPGFSLQQHSNGLTCFVHELLNRANIFATSFVTFVD